jgi:hypothetical protein
MKITNFISKYSVPELDNLNPYHDTNLNASVYHKKEFYDTKLDKIEELGEADLRLHQKLVSRYISQHTPYQGLLLFHAMGTGKTGAAIATIQNLLESGKYQTAYVVAGNKDLINNFKQEVLQFGKDILKDPKFDGIELSRDDASRDLSTALRGLGYEFYTYGSAALPTNFSNSIVVLDEAHRLVTEDSDSRNYHKFKKLLSECNNCKVLLLTGTPVINRAVEIQRLLNLILPKNREITDDFFDHSTGALVEDPAKIDEFLRKIEGYVSYLQFPMPPNIMIEYQGTREWANQSNQFILSLDFMEGEQNEVYRKMLLERPGSNEECNFKADEQPPIDISLMVYPYSQLYGSAGYQKYVKKVKDESRGFDPAYSRELRKLEGANDEVTLSNLSQYSTIYAAFLRQVLDNPTQLVLGYCRSVHGSGLMPLLFLMNTLFPRIRYIIITSDKKSSEADINAFNSPSNKNAARYQVALISDIATEGLSFMNIQQIHILSPHWNFPRISQAIARGIRLGSHEDLLKTNKQVTVKVWLHAAVAMTANGEPDWPGSYNICKWQKAQEKDMSIKRLERVLKEGAVDCALNYLRNKRENIYDDSRECEYEKCEYQCFGIPSSKLSGLAEDELDLTTYNLYYDPVVSMENVIKRIFLTNFSMSFAQIKSIVKEEISVSDTKLLEALNHIENSEVLRDQYGFSCILQNDGDNFYLGDGSLNSSTYYTQYPALWEDKEFWSEFGPDLVERLHELPEGSPLLKNFIDRFPTVDKNFLKQSLLDESLQDSEFIARLRAIFPTSQAPADTHEEVERLIRNNQIGFYAILAPGDEKNLWIKDVREDKDKYGIEIKDIREGKIKFTPAERSALNRGELVKKGVSKFGDPKFYRGREKYDSTRSGSSTTKGTNFASITKADRIKYVAYIKSKDPEFKEEEYSRLKIADKQKQFLKAYFREKNLVTTNRNLHA